MNDLLELIDARERNGIPPGFRNRRSKLFQLYQGIRTGKIKNDEQAVAILYKTSRKKAAYHKLKYKLKVQLTEELGSLRRRSPKPRDRGEALLFCQENIVTIRTLLNFDAHSNARRLGESVLKVAREFDLSRSIVSTLSLLEQTEAHSRKKERCRTDLRRYSRLAYLETLAESYYRELRDDWSSRRGPQPRLRQKADSFIDDLNEKNEETRSPRLSFFQTGIETLRHLFNLNFDRAYQGLQKSFPQLEIQAAKYPDLFTGIGLLHVHCCLALRKPEEAERILEKLRVLQQEGREGWFDVQEKTVLLKMQQGHFIDGWSSLQSAVKSPCFEHLSPLRKENWKILETWLRFLLNGALASSSPPIRLSRFLNEVPLASKDKTGRNISVSILRSLVLLQQNKKEKALQALESFRKQGRRRPATTLHDRPLLFAAQLRKWIETEEVADGTTGLRNGQHGAKSIATIVPDWEPIPYERTWRLLIRQ